MNINYFGKWKLKPAQGSASIIQKNITFPGRLKVNFPDDIYMHLLDADIIEDSFYTDYESMLTWIPQCDWQDTTDFNVKNVTDYNSLVWQGLDTLADVYLNHYHIICKENRFVPYSVSFEDILRSAANTIKLIFYSPLKKAIQKRSDAIQDKNELHYEIKMADQAEVILPIETHEILILSGELNQKTVDEQQVKPQNNYLCEMREKYGFC